MSRESSYSKAVDESSLHKHPDRVWDGPLNYIMHQSYTNGLMAGVGSTAFAFGLDRFLITPRGQPRWPAYAAVLPQYRGYGWILFCLGVFQFFVEDTETSNIITKNHDLMVEAQKDELDYIEKLEKRRLDQEKKTNANMSSKNGV